LASPADYEYIEELKLWELSFDKRPVQGVRCEDPMIGAEKYNQGREKFKALKTKSLPPSFYSVGQIASCHKTSL